MAEKGFKRKLTAILSTKDGRCSRLMHDPEEPTSHILTLCATSKTDIGKQYRLTEFYWATGCDEGRFVINFILKPITIKEKSHGKTSYQL